MKEVDYIIVGMGIAGISFCERATENNKSFVVFDKQEPGATAKSGGVLNPVILRRFTPFWNNAEFYPVTKSFYSKLAVKLEEGTFEETSILRVFKNIEEQNNWSVASDKLGLKNFLDSNFLENKNPEINAPLGFGKVLGASKIDVEKLLGGYSRYLKSKGLLVEEKFQYQDLHEKDARMTYQNIISKSIIFCEGSAATKNPFFPENALICNKGQYLIIKAPELKLKELLKGPFYVIPMGEEMYKVGATYDRNEESENPTSEARKQMVEKLKTMIQCDFEVIGQTVGIRPTTKDRRPLMGRLQKNPLMAFFNGLGTHGFLMAPLLAEMLYEHLENGGVIPEEMDVNRI